MIRHQTIGRDAYSGPVVGLSQNLLKCGVVSRLVKQREPPDTAVEDMIGEVSGSGERKGDRLLFLVVGPLLRIPYCPMPRIPRGQVGGRAYHILNRGNGGATVFSNDGDYAAFFDLLTAAKKKFPVKVFGSCLMPNHLRWYHQHYRSNGMYGRAGSRVFQFSRMAIS